MNRGGRPTPIFTLALAVAVACAATAPSRALAEEPGGPPAGAGARVRWAPVVGAVAVLAPLIAGSALWARDDWHDLQHTGVYIASAGFIAAPVIAQGMTGRWSRAAAFGLAALVTSAGAWTSMAVKDPFRPASTKEGLPFMIFLSASFFTAAAGVVDSALAAGGER